MKHKPSYKRKITWIENKNKLTKDKYALYEYVGEYPGHFCHGNSKTNNSIYISTDPYILEEVKKRVQQGVSSKQIYTEMQNEYDIFEGPRTLDQVHKQRHFNKIRNLEKNKINKNYEEQIIEIVNMAQTHEFVKKVSHGKNYPVSVRLFIDYQVKDIERFCLNGKTVFACDKTFSLGKVHVTITSFKNLSVLTENGNPIFFGPMLLHNKSDYATYFDFFGNLRSTFSNKFDNLIFGSDDEKGMHMAATAAFSGCSHVLCMKHINENIQHRLQGIGVPKIIRQQIKTLVYNLVESSDELDFTFKEKKLFEYCEIKSPTSIQYLKNVIYPKIKNHVWKPKQKIGFVWTNNNAESLNHVIKATLDWKQKSIPDLIYILYKFSE